MISREANAAIVTIVGKEAGEWVREVITKDEIV